MSSSDHSIVYSVLGIWVITFFIIGIVLCTKDCSNRHYSEEIPVGVDTTYINNGYCTVVYYKNGRKDRTEKSYYNGKLSSETIYKDGRESIQKNYDSNSGRLVSRADYSYDYGVLKVYYENGKLRAEHKQHRVGDIFPRWETIETVNYDENGNVIHPSKPAVQQQSQQQQLQQLLQMINQQQRKQTPSQKRSSTPDDAYDEGYSRGYDQGREDAYDNWRSGGGANYAGYDNSSNYYGHYAEQYEQGYEDGYRNGWNNVVDEYNNSR